MPEQTKPKNNIRLFESQEIRTAWDEEAEKWWFSIVDVVATLTESVDAAAYWRTHLHNFSPQQPL